MGDCVRIVRSIMAKRKEYEETTRLKGQVRRRPSIYNPKRSLSSYYVISEAGSGQAEQCGSGNPIMPRQIAVRSLLHVLRIGPRLVAFL